MLGDNNVVRLSGIHYESIADAKGVSCVLFISGCKHNCFQCHSPQTHDFNYGKVLDDAMIDEINSEIDKRPFLNALVLSGGDPMYSAKELLPILDKLHIPNHTIWCYTGFAFEEICKNEQMKKLLQRCDYLVDGQFQANKRDITLPFRGSSNQRLIDVKKSLKENRVILYNP